MVLFFQIKNQLKFCFFTFHEEIIMIEKNEEESNKILIYNEIEFKIKK